MADRIRLFVATDAERRAAVEAHAAYVCAETLAVEFGFEAPPDDGAVRQVTLDGRAATVGLVRVAYDGERP